MDQETSTIFSAKVEILRSRGQSQLTSWRRITLVLGFITWGLIVLAALAPKLLFLVGLLLGSTLVALHCWRAGAQLVQVAQLLIDNKDNEVALGVIRAEYLSPKTNLWLGRQGK